MSQLLRSEKRLKQDAKKLAKELGISHSEALNEVANSYGFTSWLECSRSIHEASAEYKHELHQAELFPNDEIILETRTPPELVNKEILENTIELTSRGIDFALFTSTKTGLDKSILDATQPVRTLFEISSFHDYSTQEQGVNTKVTKKAFFLTPEETVETTVSLYRPNTKKGDPRMWFSKLAAFAQPDDKVAVIVYKGCLYLINLTAVDLSRLTSSNKPNLKDFLDNFTSETETVANELLQKLKTIAKNGPLRAIKKGSTAIGMTIENALGIAANSSKDPDYKGIELKSGRGFNRTRTNLFAQVADWKISPLKSSREILDNFGYSRDDDFKLYCTVSALKANTQGLKFEIREDGELLVETHKDFGDVAVWPDKLMRRRLLEKHAETFWVSAESIEIDGVEHFQLKSVLHTRSPLQGQLMPLIESGIITMDHLIKRKSGDKPRVSEKGPLFKINKKDLPLLFPSPNKYLLK